MKITFLGFGIALLTLGCVAPTRGVARSATSEGMRLPTQRSPEPPTLHPSYRMLDPGYHYFLITSAEPLGDHYYATYHEAEGADVELRVESDESIHQEGGHCPAELMKRDNVPNAQLHELPRLRAWILAAEPRARAIAIKFLGRYRRVHLQELHPCTLEGRRPFHGMGYSNTLIVLDERGQVLMSELIGASHCGASPLYFAVSDPKWLQLRIPAQPLMANQEARGFTERGLQPDVLTAAHAVIAKPEQDWPVPTQ